MSRIVSYAQFWNILSWITRCADLFLVPRKYAFNNICLALLCLKKIMCFGGMAHFIVIYDTYCETVNSKTSWGACSPRVKRGELTFQVLNTLSLRGCSGCEEYIQTSSASSGIMWNSARTMQEYGNLPALVGTCSTFQSYHEKGWIFQLLGSGSFSVSTLPYLWFAGCFSLCLQWL